MSEPNYEISKQWLTTDKLEEMVKTYPEELREGVVWLGSYARTSCSCSMAILEQNAKKMGYDTTSTTFSKILRGRWNTDSKGKPVPPIIKLKSILQIIETLRTVDRIAKMAGKVPFVRTGTWEEIKAYIDVRRAPERVCKFGLVIGPTGAQKTASFKQYVLENNHGSCVHFDSPYNASMREFINDLASAYGFSSWTKHAFKMRKIAESVTEKRTIIIDNIQRLYKPNAGWNQPIFNYLHKLQDDTACTVILAAATDFEKILSQGEDAGYFEQFEGRCGGKSEFLILPEYTPTDDILQIAEAFQLENAEKHIGYLEQVARRRGRIRVLFNALQMAKQEAQMDSKPLTIKYLKAAADKTEDGGEE